MSTGIFLGLRREEGNFTPIVSQTCEIINVFKWGTEIEKSQQSKSHKQGHKV